MGFHGRKEQRLQLDGVPWLIAGHDYLVPITYTTLTPNSPEDPSWIPLGSKNAMPFDSGKIGNGEQILIGDAPYRGRNPSGETPMRDAVWGTTGADAGAVLTKARPDPAAAKYINLLPIDRYAAVQKDAGANDEPDPREKEGHPPR